MTKEEVIKKFEELGYECVCDSDRELILEKNEEINSYYILNCERIHIDKHFKNYIVIRITKGIGGYRQKPEYLSFKEHQLLTELFKCEGWIDEKEN